MSSLPPNTVGVPFDTGRELRALYQQVQTLISQLQTQGALTRAQADALYAPPLPAIKKALESGSALQLNVTGLSGLLAQPQQGGAPLLPVAPVQGSPAAQDGALYRTVSGGSSVLRFWNGSTDPGVDTPITASGLVTVRKNNTTTIGTEGTLDFLEGTGITLTMTDTAGEIRITPAINSVLASIKTGSATLDFPSTLPSTSSDLTITVTGALDGDPVILGVPNSCGSLVDSSWSAWVDSTNSVTVRFSNWNPVLPAVDPPSATFKVAVLHF